MLVFREKEPTTYSLAHKLTSNNGNGRAEQVVKKKLCYSTIDLIGTVRNLAMLR